MYKYKLVCKKDNEIIIRELLKSNNIITDQTSTIVICEEGADSDGNYDIVIYFKKDKIMELIEFIKGKYQNEYAVIMGKSEDHYVPIDINNVVFFSAYGNDTFANIIDGKQYKIKYKLYELESEVLEKCFIRINKSQVVNIKHIVKIIPMFKGKLILKIQGYKETIDISRNYIKEFKERIGM